MNQKFRRIFPAICFLFAAFVPQSIFACAACYGKSDSALAQGMNWGIFSLLAIVVCVMGTITTFFVYLAKKSAATLKHSSTLAEPTQKN
ncbi:MAG: hypothetical protein M3Y82_12520 [Verrucomicrobiota bacterium]|nr:hypothetical protein [Verrucomicrobiota bacterium]